MTDDFGRRLLGLLTGHVLTTMIAIGHRTGLLAAAADGPATPAELAARAGLAERYVREWLGAVATGGIVELAADGRYVLPPAHAALLTGERAANVAPGGGDARGVGHRRAAGRGALRRRRRGAVRDIRGSRADGRVLAARLRNSDPGGSAASRPQPGVEQLVDGFLGPVPGLLDRLRAGIRLLDVGCGTGHAVAVLARACPRSEFVGLDVAPDAVAAADRNAAGQPNARLVVADAAELPDRPVWDVITAFDAVHDQRAPATVLRRVCAALAPGGTFVMVDAKFHTAVADNPRQPARRALLRDQHAVLRPDRARGGRPGPRRDVGDRTRPGDAARRRVR